MKLIHGGNEVNPATAVERGQNWNTTTSFLLTVGNPYDSVIPTVSIAYSRIFLGGVISIS